MNTENEKESVSRGDEIVQDGVACPGNPPWKPTVKIWTTLSMLPISLIGIPVLVMTNIPKLVLWLLLMGIFCYPLRYLVCARCPYYGQDCSTYFGLWVPRLFKKQEGKSMRLGLWLDVVFFMILFVLPLPEIWQLGGLLLLLAWVAALLTMVTVLSRLACSVCPLTFCPIGKMSRGFWSRFG